MANAFAQGMRLGADIYDEADRGKRARELLDMQKETHGRQMELADQQLASGRRQARLNDQIDTANAGIQSFINNGTMTGNNSGFSDESARMMFDQGGSRIVDDAASYGNVEAARLGVARPYMTGGVAARPYDPANLDDQAGLNRRIMGAAALKGDYATVGTLQAKNQELAETQIFNEGVKRFSMNPDSFTEITRYINKSNPLITAAPAKDPRTGQLTGYNLMTVGPSGDAAYKFISPQQSATLAGAIALMNRNPAKALQIIATVDQGLAATIAAQNTAAEKTAATNNQAMHFANQDVSQRMTAEAHQTMARAATERASRERQTEGDKMQERIDAYSGIIQRQNPGISKADADKKAADIILRDPNAKEPADLGLAEAGLVRINGKIFKQGKNGLEAVTLPGQSNLDKALEAYLAKGGKKSEPAPAKPKGGMPSMTQMSTPAGLQPYRSNADQIRDAERRQR